MRRSHWHRFRPGVASVLGAVAVAAGLGVVTGGPAPAAPAVAAEAPVAQPTSVSASVPLTCAASIDGGTVATGIAGTATVALTAPQTVEAGGTFALGGISIPQLDLGGTSGPQPAFESSNVAVTAATLSLGLAGATPSAISVQATDLPVGALVSDAEFLESEPVVMAPALVTAGATGSVVASVSGLSVTVLVLDSEFGLSGEVAAATCGVPTPTPVVSVAIGAGATPAVVTGVYPDLGSSAGGQSATVVGAGLAGASAVDFGTTGGADLSVAADGAEATVTSPPGTGTVQVTAVTPTGSTDGVPYTYEPPPTVSGVSPAGGPPTGGTEVAITGTNLTGATTVDFGTAPAQFAVEDATTIVALSPAGTGTVDVTVQTPAGTSTTSSADEFVYAPPPTITALSPAGGPAAGGTSITVSGSGFTGATRVGFNGVDGGVDAESFTVDSDTQMTVVAPPGNGPVSMVVLTPGGTASAAYTYPPLVVSALAPGTGPASGGTPVTISGSGLGGVTGVYLSGIRCFVNRPLPFTVVSDTQITAVTPPGSGVCAVELVGTDQRVTLPDAFTYTPAVSAVVPSNGSPDGGTQVTIKGRGFDRATAVLFGNTPAESFHVDGDGKIVATAPPGTGTVDVVVVGPGGTSAATSADQFSFTPTVSSLAPASGNPAGGTTVDITGVGFTGATAVSFGATPASFVVESDTRIVATAPPGTGTVDVTVSDPPVTSPVVTGDQFTYVAAPSVSAVSPSVGQVGGGTVVQIQGTGFVGVTGVSFGVTAARKWHVLSPTTIQATTPPGTGTVDVAVSTASGTSTSSAAATFTFVARPTVSGVSPSSGPVAGGIPVTVSGTGFSDVEAVEFGKRRVAFTVEGPGTIVATAPRGTFGAVVDITVRTPINASTTSVDDQFSYGGPLTASTLTMPCTYAQLGLSITGNYSLSLQVVAPSRVGRGRSFELVPDVRSADEMPSPALWWPYSDFSFTQWQLGIAATGATPTTTSSGARSLPSAPAQYPMLPDLRLAPVELTAGTGSAVTVDVTGFSAAFTASAVGVPVSATLECGTPTDPTVLVVPVGPPLR